MEPTITWVHPRDEDLRAYLPTTGPARTLDALLTLADEQFLTHRAFLTYQIAGEQRLIVVWPDGGIDQIVNGEVVTPTE